MRAALVMSPDIQKRWTAIGMLALAAAGIYAVGLDNGQLTSIFTGDLTQQLSLLHELFHDARHAAGFPCH